jgi:hypothetical protein
MKTRLEGNRLIIRDQPFGFWLYYSFFVAGGSIALILSLAAAPDATTSLVGSISPIAVFILLSLPPCRSMKSRRS